MKLTPIVKGLALAGLLNSLAFAASADTSAKEATEATKKANDALYNQLPFSDNTDFTNAHKGFIAALPPEVIKGEQGNVIWDPGQYAFIKEGEKAPETVNPSLWRQSQLINISGLFEVTDGVYQIRNLDLSNMTIIEGKEGITVVDPLVSAETAKVGMDLYYKNRGKKPVVAVIYTHSHVDHYGGVRGRLYGSCRGGKHHGRERHESPRQLYVRQPAEARCQRPGGRRAGHHHLCGYRHPDCANQYY